MVQWFLCLPLSRRDWSVNSVPVRATTSTSRRIKGPTARSPQRGWAVLASLVLGADIWAGSRDDWYEAMRQTVTVIGVLNKKKKDVLMTILHCGK